MFVDFINLFSNRTQYIFSIYFPVGQDFQRSLYEPPGLQLRSNAEIPVRPCKIKKLYFHKNSGKSFQFPFSPVVVLFPRILTQQGFPILS
jgi:hypothetical protein